MIDVLALSVLAGAAQAPHTQELLRISTAPAETLAVTVQGAGTPVVLVPGLLGGAFGYRKVTDALVERGYRTVVIEPLGTGGSTRPENADYSLTGQADRIAHVLDSLGIAQNVLVCHQIGGSMCLRVAYRRPDLVRGIVSINGGPAERGGTSGLRRALSLAGFIKFFTGDDFIIGKLRGGLKDSSADPSWVTDDVMHGYTGAFEDDFGDVLGGMKRIAAAEEPEQLAPNLPDIDIPVRLLIGEGDENGMSDEELNTLITHLDGLSVERIADAGQYIQEERPEVVVAAIVELFATLDAEARR
jgi:pimeloyl-ACP methyl ester carboxylesterase